MGMNGGIDSIYLIREEKGETNSIRLRKKRERVVERMRRPGCILWSGLLKVITGNFWVLTLIRYGGKWFRYINLFYLHHNSLKWLSISPSLYTYGNWGREGFDDLSKGLKPEVRVNPDGFLSPNSSLWISLLLPMAWTASWCCIHLHAHSVRRLIFAVLELAQTCDFAKMILIFVVS